MRGNPYPLFLLVSGIGWHHIIPLPSPLNEVRGAAGGRRAIEGNSESRLGGMIMLSSCVVASDSQKQ